MGIYWKFLSLTLASLAMGITPSRAGVVVVSQSPGSTITTIQAGINAAVDGDVVLIKTGDYGPATITNRSLTLIGDGTVRVGGWFSHGLEVKDLIHFGQIVGPRYVVLKNIEFFGVKAEPMQWDALSIENCAAPVVIDSCRFNVTVSPAGWAGRGIFVNNSQNVVITDSLVVGGPAVKFSFPPFGSHLGKPALEVMSSSVQCYGSTFLGGAGLKALVFPPPTTSTLAQPGATAIVMNGGSSLLNSCQLIGGTGGDGVVTADGLYCAPPKVGGSALWLKTNSPTVRTAGSTFSVGNTGAPSGSPSCPDPQPPFPPALVVDSGSLITLPSNPGTLDGPLLLHENASSSLSLFATSGDAALLFLGTSPAYSFVTLPQYAGTLVPAIGLYTQTLGTIPANGTLTVPFTLSSLPPSVSATKLFLQGATGTPSGNWALTGPSAMIVVDSGL